MSTIIHQNIVLENPNTKPFLADITYRKGQRELPLIIFAHGYKGYKDWGAWNLVAEAFAKLGFYFVKFNFSYNGTSTEEPTHFVDLESFGQNNYSKELSDYTMVIDYFSKQPEIDSNAIILMGHSRGGGISIIKAYEDERVKALITLASVSNLNRFPKKENLKQWQKEGVFYSQNHRTNQAMPHYFQFYEDFKANEARFNVERAMKTIKIPTLIIQGTEDEAVPLKNAELLHAWNPNSELFIIKGVEHTFGAKEPWDNDILPLELEIVISESNRFIKEHFKVKN